MDGYLFFDEITPETRSALLELVDDELLTMAAVTVSGSAAAFAVYEADDVRTAYATIEAVTSSVGAPSQRLLAVTGGRAPSGRRRPGRRSVPEDSVVVMALLPVPLGRAVEVSRVLAHVAVGAGIATVVGGRSGVLVEVDGTDADAVQEQLAEVLTAAGVDSADVLVTTTALARWQS